MRRILRGFVLLLLILLLLSLLGFGLFRSRYLPVLGNLAQAQAKTATLKLIDEAIAGQIESGTLRYDKIVLLEKDVNGRVTALKTNMQEVNRLKSVILQLINHRVLSLDTSRIGISLGSLLLPELWSGKGPSVPVHILAIRNSNASFLSHFSQAGINQTLHQIHLNVTVEGTILVLGEVRSFSVSSSVLVAETVIVGDVPNSFS